MKKILFPLTSMALLAVLILAACASKASTTGSTAGNSASSGSGSSQGNGATANTTQPLPLVAQLLVGTFKLEGTANAVDAKEAAALLPLWQAYAQLLTSNTTAQAETDAVISQIQSTMTPQQVQAITAMKLTRQDMFTTMSTLGLANFQPGANGTPGFSGTPGARGAGGFGGDGGGGFGGGDGGGFGGGGGGGFTGGGGGGFTGGGGGGFGGGGAGTTGGGAGTGSFNPTQIATLRAARARTGGIPNSLLKALTDLLQKKAQS